MSRPEGRYHASRGHGIPCFDPIAGPDPAGGALDAMTAHRVVRRASVLRGHFRGRRQDAWHCHSRPSIRIRRVDRALHSKFRKFVACGLHRRPAPSGPRGHRMLIVSAGRAQFLVECALVVICRARGNHLVNWELALRSTGNAVEIQSVALHGLVRRRASVPS